MKDYFDGCLSALAMFLVVIGLIVALFSPFIFFVATAQSKACEQYSLLGYETHYEFWSGCMIKDKNLGWLPSNEFFKRINIITIDGD